MTRLLGFAGLFGWLAYLNYGTSPTWAAATPVGSVIQTVAFMLFFAGWPLVSGFAIFGVFERKARP